MYPERERGQPKGNNATDNPINEVGEGVKSTILIQLTATVDPFLPTPLVKTMWSAMIPFRIERLKETTIVTSLRSNPRKGTCSMRGSDILEKLPGRWL